MSPVNLPRYPYACGPAPCPHGCSPRPMTLAALDLHLRFSCPVLEQKRGRS